MKIHVRTTWIMSVICFASLLGAWCLRDNTFELSICAGLFASGVLVLISSIVAYFVEKREALLFLSKSIAKYQNAILDFMLDDSPFPTCVLLTFHKKLYNIRAVYDNDVDITFRRIHFFCRRTKTCDNIRKMFQYIERVNVGVNNDIEKLDKDRITKQQLAPTIAMDKTHFGKAFSANNKKDYKEFVALFHKLHAKYKNSKFLTPIS